MLQRNQFFAAAAVAPSWPRRRHVEVILAGTLRTGQHATRVWFYGGKSSCELRCNPKTGKAPRALFRRGGGDRPQHCRPTLPVEPKLLQRRFAPQEKNKGVPLKILRSVVLAASASVGLFQAATAADLGGAPPYRSIKDAPVVYERPFSWSGLYIGAHAGYGWSDVKWDDALGPGDHQGNGWLAGGQVGYNVQSGQFVFGIEADLSSTWINGNNDCCGHQFNWLASARGRAGLAINGNRTLLYATGGAAWADVEYSSPGVSGFSNTHFGWVAGGGIEHMLTQNLSARVEYLHYSFDDATGPVGILTTTAEPKLDTVRFGLNLKF